MESKYQYNAYDLGDVKHGQTPNFFFPISNGVVPDDVSPGCSSCTFPRLQPSGDILGHIVITNAIGRDHKTGSLRTGPFTKTITVYQPDGKKLDLENNKKVKYKNPDKGKLFLKISGNVTK